MHEHIYDNPSQITSSQKAVCDVDDICKEAGSEVSEVFREQVAGNEAACITTKVQHLPYCCLWNFCSVLRFGVFRLMFDCHESFDFFLLLVSLF